MTSRQQDRSDVPRINARRLQSRLDTLAEIGALENGGVCRMAFTEADKRGRDYVEAAMRELGLAIRIDRIGNLLGTRPGMETGPIVLAGSHVDTVGTGGRFDGSVGVMGALEVLQTLNDHGIMTRHPIGVVAFANEEGARFMPDMMGSLVFVGRLTVDEARRSIDRDGTSAGAAIDRVGFAGNDDFTGLEVKAYLELHIEQGPILEHTGATIGLVEAVQGLRWIRFTLTGASAHAGATPIEMRKDAAYVAGAIMQFARTLSHGIEGQRATVGSLELVPNLVNVVAAQARLTVDLRNPDPDRLDEAEQRLRDFVSQIGAAEKVEVEAEVRVDVPPVQFDENIVTAIEAASDALGLRSMRMVSGAGHDAQILAMHFPAGMIFVPSSDGISHNIREFTATEDLAAGANVLLRTLLGLA